MRPVPPTSTPAPPPHDDGRRRRDRTFAVVMAFYGVVAVYSLWTLLR